MKNWQSFITASACFVAAVEADGVIQWLFVALTLLFVAHGLNWAWEWAKEGDADEEKTERALANYDLLSHSYDKHGRECRDTVGR